MHTIALIVLVLPTFAVFIFQCSGRVRPVYVFFGLCSVAGNRGVYMRAAVHAHARAHLCYEA